MPRGLNRLWVLALADINYWWRRETRAAVERNLEPILGGCPAALKETSRRVFRNYAQLLVDYAKYFGKPAVQVDGVFAHAEGYEHLENALRAGRGVLLVTAHIGFWELGGLLFRQWGIPVSVVSLEDPDPGVHAERTRIRSSLGIETITLGQNAWGGLAVARALRQNRLVAMLVDRYRGPSPVAVEMFGQRTHFAPGPALYARMTNAAIIPAFVVADGLGRYRGIVSPSVGMQFTGNRDSDLARNTQLLARVIERVIQQFPDQWYNFDNVWGTA